MSKLTVCGRTDKGRERAHNEDAFAVVEMGPGERALLVVCDGMGGHAGGQAASQLATERLVTTFMKLEAGVEPAERLEVAIDAANHAVVERAEREPELRGMGATCVVAYIDGGSVWTGHVGDSRLYQVRGNRIQSRTKDHSVVQRMVDSNMLTPAEAKRHPDANVITQAIGKLTNREGGAMRPTLGRLFMEDGDVLMLCSDGLTDLVEDDEVARLCSSHEPAEAAEQLIALANHRGGHDNITVAIARYGTAQAAAVRRTTITEPSKKAGFGWKAIAVAVSGLLALALVAALLFMGPGGTPVAGAGEGDVVEAADGAVSSVAPAASSAAATDVVVSGAPNSGESGHPGDVLPSGDVFVSTERVPGQSSPAGVIPGTTSLSQAGAFAGNQNAIRQGGGTPAEGRGAGGFARPSGAEVEQYGFSLQEWLKDSPKGKVKRLLELDRKGIFKEWTAEKGKQIVHGLRGAELTPDEKEELRGSVCRLLQHAQTGSVTRTKTIRFVEDLQRQWTRSPGGLPACGQ